MKINGSGGINPIHAYQSHVKNQNTEVNHKKEEVRGDTLELSAEARKIQDYLSKLEKLPEVREDLVASLKKQIQEGTYRPDSNKIAAGIIQERLMDKEGRNER